MNQTIKQDCLNELKHYGKKGMKWDDEKKKKKKKTDEPPKKQSALDKLLKSLEKADVLVVKKRHLTVSELLQGTGNGKVELRGFTKVNTQTESDNGKIKLKGFTKVRTKNESGTTKVELKGFTKKVR